MRLRHGRAPSRTGKLTWSVSSRRRSRQISWVALSRLTRLMQTRREARPMTMMMRAVKNLMKKMNVL